MDIPAYTSSSAFSREQYALVRKVELAGTPNVADGYILAAADVLRARLLTAGLGIAPRVCREALVLLLYCATAISPHNAGSLDVTFAFPHAANLAEAGHTVQDKSLGYLFCRELLPREHELQLMLVNTIHKDLESDAVPHIVLALDTLIHAPSRDVLPAVQRRLVDLSAHHSPHVRRRALLAVRALAAHDPELLRAYAQRVRKRVEDTDTGVSRAALRLCDAMVEHDALSREAHAQLLDKALCTYWDTHKAGPLRAIELLPILQSIATTRPHLSASAVRALLELIRAASTPAQRSDPLLLGAFRALSALPLAALPPGPALAGRRSPAHALRPLLAGGTPNTQHAFLACLQRLPPPLWADALGAPEVARVVGLADARDPSIRGMTLQVLRAVDPSLVSALRTKLLQSPPARTEGPGWTAFVERVCEFATAECGEDGAAYITHIAEMLGALDSMVHTTPAPVHEGAVERVLTHVRDSLPAFQTSALSALLALDLAGASPTLAVLAAALTCSHAPHAPADALSALVRALPAHTPPVQDALLLALLRLTAERAGGVPEDALAAVRALEARAGRYIRRRCEQVLAHARQPAVLKRLVASAPSSDLPAFLALLHAHEARAGTASLPGSPHAGHAPLPSSPPTSPRALAAAKLRYAAYPAPTSPPLSTLRAGLKASASPRALAARALESTITPGDLALGGLELDNLRSIPAPAPELQSRREDLITLDSPFLADPAPLPPIGDAPDFAATWARLASFTSRGWCALPLDAAVRRLQSLRLRLIVLPADRPPFDGSLKVLVTQPAPDDTDSVDSAQGEEETAALRLTEGEDESCLWQTRCDGAHLASRIREVLATDS